MRYRVTHMNYKHITTQTHTISLSFCLSYPRDKSVSSLRWGEVQGQDISCVAVETLQQLPALHIPQGTCAITTGGQDLTHTYSAHMHMDKCTHTHAHKRTTTSHV